MKLYRKGRPPKPQRDNILSTSIRIDRDLWAIVKAEAVAFHLTIDEYIEQIIKERTMPDRKKEELEKKRMQNFLDAAEKYAGLEPVIDIERERTNGSEKKNQADVAAGPCCWD